MRRLVVLALVSLLAGCADSGPAVDPVVTIDSAVVQVGAETSNGPASTAPLGEGTIRGVVVDDSITPIADAVVRSPGLEKQTRTGPDGSFVLQNLPEGATYIRAEHPDFLPSAVEVEVTAGGIADARIVLTSNVVEPHVRVQSFTGFADVTMSEVVMIFTGCDYCEFQINVPADAEALIMEAASNRGPSADPTGILSDRFYWSAYDSSNDRIDSSLEDDPFRIEALAGPLLEEPTYSFRLKPHDYIPNLNVEFELFVATFHGGADPAAWSIVGVDA